MKNFEKKREKAGHFEGAKNTEKTRFLMDFHGLTRR